MIDCGVCGSEVRPFLSFGKQPLGNAFLKKEDFDKEKRFELELGLCVKCKLVQQTHPPPVEALESDYRNYAYVPFGTTLAAHYQEMAGQAVLKAGINDKSLTVDVGSNNGLLLGIVGRLTGCRILGVEPAERISQIARDSGVPTITSFFTKDIARHISITQGYADLVVCTQTLQHIPDVNEFVSNLGSLLKPEGLLLIEGRYFGATMAKRSYDTVYHEMQWFFTLRSLEELLNRNGLYVAHAEENDIYGGSLRVYARKAVTERLNQAPNPPYQGVVSELEDQQQLADLRTYRRFARLVRTHRDRLAKLLWKLEGEGKKIAAYGAPSTSATLLNYCGIGSKILSYVVDDSPLKQGLYTPGTHIPIVSSERFAADPPDYLLLNAWRLKSEILPKVSKQRKRGMKIIIPLPEIEVI